jgi:hypothetical protein
MLEVEDLLQQFKEVAALNVELEARKQSTQK